MARRVTATVQREASRLVHLSTERETLLTTPEHPFAVPGSGWLSAGRLLPGDGLLSESFGAVRVSSVRSVSVARPIPVFNLSVPSSHSYFVGTDRVLVHNTKCKQAPSVSPEEDIARIVREREELLREIADLTQTTPTSPRIAELKTQRRKLLRRIHTLQETQRRRQGVSAPNKQERARRVHEADFEAAKAALEAAQKELADLESRQASSEAERPALAARKEELQKQIAGLQLSADRLRRILTLLQELATLEQGPPATAAGRWALEDRKRALRAELDLERKRARVLKHARKRRADPAGREERAAYQRSLKGRLRRGPTYLGDPARPRDRLELLEEELARQRQEAPSEGRDARILHLTEQIDTMRKLVEARRKQDTLRQRRFKARREHEKRRAAGEDTSDLDRYREQLESQSFASRIEVGRLRVRERLLLQLDETPWAHAPGFVDQARLHEFERQLSQGLESEQQLTSIERVLDAAVPTYADSQEAVFEESRDVDELLSEREELIRQRPSPERLAAIRSSCERLEQELREERAAVEVAVSALVSEYAHIQTTQAASSSGPSWRERLLAVQEELDQLRAHWRTSLQSRLGSAQRQLRLIQGAEWLRDEAVEADLVGEIALLERELQMASG